MLAPSSAHHVLAELLDGLAMFLLDGKYQVGFGAEVVTHRCVVALAGRLADLPVGYREHAVLGIQPLSGRQDRLLSRGGPLTANGPAGCGHSAS